jgi:hypothetical protein
MHLGVHFVPVAHRKYQEGKDLQREVGIKTEEKERGT